MLPNWLYGKSKSKLAELLGGGGTPSDYNQVKAQVTQNTEDITALLDNLEVTGAVNMLPNTNVTQTKYGITYTVNDDGSITASGTATNANGLYQNITLPKGTYKLSGCPSGGSQNTYYIGIVSLNIYDYGDGAIFTLSQETTMEVTIARINNTTTTYSNLTFKPMITVPSYNGDYVPYAMTNQELTEKLTSDADLGTAVDLSTYAAYSNMYTAPSDGYVHFQSAASGSTARTIYTYGNNTTAATDPHFTHSTSVNNKAFEIYIRKGLKIYVDGLQSGDTINFYPLS